MQGEVFKDTEAGYFSFFVTSENSGERLDAFLAYSLDRSRSLIKKLIDDGNVRLNSQSASPAKKLKAGDHIAGVLPIPSDIEVLPQDIPLDIIYQDSSLAVINKPRGMSVHPGAGRNSGTVVNALLYSLEGLSGIGGKLRPGIVHRLDMNTSGVMIVAKNDKAHLSLSNQFAERRVKKEYMAIVHGRCGFGLKKITASIGRHLEDRKKMAVTPSGRYAETVFKTERVFDNYSLVKAYPQTGRTHQIRLHLAYAGFPIVGDFLYGAPQNPWNISVQMLHACKICFLHPETGAEMVFAAPVPFDMLNLLSSL